MFKARFSVNFHHHFHGHHFCQDKARNVMRKILLTCNVYFAWFSVRTSFCLLLALPVYDITCFGVVVKLEEFFSSWVVSHSSCVKTMWSGLLFFLLGLIQVNNGQSRSRGCSSRSGKPCVFPFFYNGTLYDGEKRNCKERKITVFENHRKSLIQHCERSELLLHFELTKVH